LSLEWVKVIFVSMLPVSELRGSIPYAMLLGLSPAEAYAISVIGNFIPVPVVLFILKKFDPFFRRIPYLGSIYVRILGIGEKRKRIVEKYGYPGLTVFVAIPLPVTGAWTGTLISFLLGLNTKKASLFILAGILIAGLIVTSATYGIKLAFFR